MRFFNLQKFFSPDDGSGGSADDFSADMAVLNQPPAESPAPPSETAGQYEGEPKGEGEEVEEDDEDEGDEADETESTEETPETDEGDKALQIPKIGQIKKEFPGIFTKFPELKNSHYRNLEFSKTFATPEDAANAAQKADSFDRLEASLVSGDPNLLMTELHANNPRALEQVATNWLPQLRKLDERLYATVTEPILEELIYLAFNHGNKIGDKNLAMSARHIANFIYANGGEIPDPRKRAQGPSEAEVQLQKERQEWADTRFREADTEIFRSVTRSLDQSIRHGLDPAGTMPERMKTSIVEDVINEINSVLMRDTGHGRRMQALWRRGQTDSFSQQSKESIINTYLSGARPLLREIRNRIRSEYLGSAPPKGAAPLKKRTFEGSSRQVNRQRERASVLDPRKIDYSRTSDMDILMDKITPRK